MSPGTLSITSMKDWQDVFLDLIAFFTVWNTEPLLSGTTRIKSELDCAVCAVLILFLSFSFRIPPLSFFFVTSDDSMNKRRHLFHASFPFEPKARRDMSFACFI